MSPYILKINFSLPLTLIIIFKPRFHFNICTYRGFQSMFCVGTSLAIHFQRAAMLQHRSILLARLNFRTRLFYLALTFAVSVCASLCFLIFARFVRRLISGTTRSSFFFQPSSSVFVFIFNLGSCCCSAYLSSCHGTASDANLLDDPHTFHFNDYFVIGGIYSCLAVSDDPMFLWISNSRPLNLLLVGIYQAEIIIVKRHIQGRNSVTRVRVEPRSFDQGRRKNDAFTHSATHS